MLNLALIVENHHYLEEMEKNFKLLLGQRPERTLTIEEIEDILALRRTISRYVEDTIELEKEGKAIAPLTISELERRMLSARIDEVILKDGTRYVKKVPTR